MKLNLNAVSQCYLAALRAANRQWQRCRTRRKTVEAALMGLKNEIASSQRLVAQSAQSVRRVARGFRSYET
jgi:hypothetical protein